MQSVYVLLLVLHIDDDTECVWYDATHSSSYCHSLRMSAVWHDSYKCKIASTSLYKLH